MLIFTLSIAGIIAGLVQYFVDFLKLPVHLPSTSALESIPRQQPDFFSRLSAYLKNNWEFFGYLTVGIAGALLVPVIDQLLQLKGVKEYLDCVGQPADAKCKNADWNLLVILGYGIISGYSSVSILRGFGAVITSKIGKDVEQQKKELENAKKEIEELKAKVAAKGSDSKANELPADHHLLEGEVEAECFCDANEEVGIAEALEVPECKQFPAPWKGKKWRLAGSLKVLLNEVNIKAPKRNKTSDGTIGDTAHQGRISDHNPWVLDVEKNIGIVTALDITNDPINKCDCNILAARLQELKDKRVKYVIWNKQIMSAVVVGGSQAWTWRPYTGTNPHNKHMHVSVICQVCDDAAKWSI